ncbi:MAG TPA: glycosyltransferase 87 family protein [Methanomassiliicoccales archaeon]|nr:glycosyltransferase 87 family protein [Euryarchaeota archaeon]HOO04576.1 glycosyltransferase 87 family protein [Methanomassiliicoccales archaeon]HRU11259.1 glycosyltransferase 87 family protein [Methanomassiliicoccales archaeon]
MSLEGRWQRLHAWLRALSPARKLAFYAIITLLVYGTTIVVDNAVLVSMLDEDLSHPDLGVYRARAQTILDGGLLYRDVHTETPPVINYLLVPPQLLGGAEHDWVWSIYFSLFAFLLAALMYLGLRPFDEDKAYLAGLLVLLSPYTIVESGTGEDESIVAFVFMLSVVLMQLRKKHLASASIGVGVWTKMFPILLFPVHFLQQRNWRDRILSVAIVGAATALIALPFAVLCWNDFSFFLNFYFLGEEGRPTGGHSIWHFLWMGGWAVPSTVQLALLGGAMAVAYLYPHHKGMPVWQSVTVMLMAFFIFYPKVHGGYWIMLVAMLSVWAVQDRKVLLRTFLAFVPMILATMFARGEVKAPPVEFYGSWFLGFLLALLGLLLFVDAVRLAMRQSPFTDGDQAQSSRLPASGPERQS